MGGSFIKRRNVEPGATSGWNQEGIPSGLPRVYRHSAPWELLNSSRPRRVGLRSSRSPSNSLFFHQHVPWSRSAKSYNSSPAFRSTVSPIVRMRLLQPTNLRELLSRSEPFSSPMTEKSLSQMQRAERSAITMVPLGGFRRQIRPESPARAASNRGFEGQQVAIRARSSARQPRDGPGGRFAPCLRLGSSRQLDCPVASDHPLRNEACTFASWRHYPFRDRLFLDGSNPCRASIGARDCWGYLGL